MAQPNRSSSDWLPGVEKCPNRAVPCGNPLDADEAMRAGQIEAANAEGFLERQHIQQAIKNATRTAVSCNSDVCPLEEHFGTNRFDALEELRKLVK